MARAFAGLLLGVGACGPAAAEVEVAAIVLDDAGAPLNRATCVSSGVPGLGTDSSLCAFPQSCLGGGVCAPGGPPSPAIPNPRIGCLPPAGMCYLPGPLFNGVADGVCVVTDTRQGRRGLQCMACQPSVSPWAYTPLPDGNDCDDGNACTRNDTCSSGNCAGICDESLPTCAGECSIDD